MLVTFVRKNVISVSILFFFLGFLLLSQLKPNLVYNEDGTFKDFGLGYKNKTIFPMWLVVILLALASYTFVLFLISYPRIQF